MRINLGFVSKIAAIVALVAMGCGGPASDNKGDLANMSLDHDLAAPNLDLGGIKDFTLTDDIGSVVGIACGDTPCPANAGQVCCTSTQGKTGTCTAGAASSCGSGAFECDGPEDCPPFLQYCCVAGGVAQCTATACPGTTAGGFGMCHLSGDCATVGGSCCPSSTGGPYRLCLPMGCQ